MSYYVRWCKHCQAVKSWHHFIATIKVWVCDTCKHDLEGKATDPLFAQQVSDLIEQASKKEQQA